jgi:hypothetical protein
VVLSTWRLNAVQVWDANIGEIVEEYLDFAVPINAIRFQGDLVVAELATGRVVRRNAATGECTTLATGLIVPSGLAAADGDLLAADWASGVVWKIMDDGVPVVPIPVATGLSGPEGLALQSSDSLLVVESVQAPLTHRPYDRTG